MSDSYTKLKVTVTENIKMANIEEHVESLQETEKVLELTFKENWSKLKEIRKNLDKAEFTACRKY